MDWEGIQQGFWDELGKIAEVNLSGLSTKTLLDYPQAEPMETPGLQQARRILALADQYRPAIEGAEKSAAASHGVRPDRLPSITVLVGKRKKQEKPDKVDQAKRVAGHALAGAGAGKFLHDWTESAIQTGKKTTDRLAPRYKLLATTGGAALGLAELGRKVHKERKQGKTVTAAAGPRKPFQFPASGAANQAFLAGKPGPTIKGVLGKQLAGQRGQLPVGPRV